ncbi:MAG: hypothetical protein AMXMBFR82_09550 [Candidatus Hydrogenedentota bacterium]
MYPAYGIAQALILMLAFAWPFDAMLYLPLLNVPLLPLAGGIVVVLAVIDGVRHRERRPPFELIWPVVLSVLLIWFAPVVSNRIQFTIGFVLFLAVAQFSHDPLFVRNCLRATGFSGAVLAAMAGSNFVIELLRSTSDQFVDAQSPGIQTAPMLTSPEAYWQGLFTVAVCFLALCEGWLRTPRLRSVLPALAIGVSGFAALSLLSGLALGLPEAPTPGIAHGALMILLLWLGARLSAALVIYRREHGVLTRIAPVLTALVLVGLAILLPHAAFPGALILCGLLAANTRAACAPEQRTLPAVLCALPVAALLILNAAHVYPGNRDDPRNFEAYLREDVREGRLDRAWHRAGRIRYWHPDEPRACLWSARLALAFDRPYQAAHEFASAVELGESVDSILPPPTEEEIDDFLVRLRDYCSVRPDPDSEYAYEKALLAANEEASALTLLKQKAQRLPLDAAPVDRELLAAVAGFALEYPGADLEVSGLADAELWSLLRAWDVEVKEGALPGLPQPEAVAILFGVNSMFASLHGAGDSHDDTAFYLTTIEGSRADPSEAPPNSRWMVETGTGDVPQVRLVRTAVAGETAAFHVIDESENFEAAISEDLIPSFPDKPALLVLLP